MAKTAMRAISVPMDCRKRQISMETPVSTRSAVHGVEGPRPLPSLEQQRLRLRIQNRLAYSACRSISRSSSNPTSALSQCSRPLMLTEKRSPLAR